MRPAIYTVPVPFHLALSIMPRPRGGDWLADEMAGLHAAGVRVLVSLLEPAEQWALDLADEPMQAQAAGVHFLSCPIPDRRVPPFAAPTFAFIADLATRVTNGQHVAIHCRLGIGRSGLMAASVLVQLGAMPDQAFAMLTRVRGLTVPDTQEQVAWVQAFARQKPMIP